MVGSGFGPVDLQLKVSAFMTETSRAMQRIVDQRTPECQTMPLDYSNAHIPTCQGLNNLSRRDNSSSLMFPDDNFRSRSRRPSHSVPYNSDLFAASYTWSHRM